MLSVIEDDVKMNIFKFSKWNYCNQIVASTSFTSTALLNANLESIFFCAEQYTSSNKNPKQIVNKIKSFKDFRARLPIETLVDNSAFIGVRVKKGHGKIFRRVKQRWAGVGTTIGSWAFSEGRHLFLLASISGTTAILCVDAMRNALTWISQLSKELDKCTNVRSFEQSAKRYWSDNLITKAW